MAVFTVTGCINLMVSIMILFVFQGASHSKSSIPDRNRKENNMTVKCAITVILK